MSTIVKKIKSPPTPNKTGPAILSGSSPICVAPGQCEMIVIVTPMKAIPIATTSSRIVNGLHRGGIDRRCIRATYVACIMRCCSSKLIG